MTDSQELIPHVSAPLTQYMPQDGKGLMVLAEQAALSGMFMNGRNALTKPQAFVIMMKGAEMGLSPLQSLEHISIVKGRPFVGAAVMAAKVRSHPSVVDWDVESDAKHCTITFQRKGHDKQSMTVNIDDIPKSYFKPSQNGEPSTWTTIPEDKLFAWTVRRVARRYFPDALLDLGDAAQEEAARVIDVAAVEKHVGVQDAVGVCTQCGEPTYLHPNRNGGVYSECANGHRQSPPQEVRDAVRGRTDEFFVTSPDTSISTEYIDQHVNPEPGFPEFDGRDPTPDERLALRKEWTQEILKALHDNMVDNVPHDIHKSLLVNWGWDGKAKVTNWLATRTWDELSDFHDEIMAVEI